ncbi:Nn.00g022910.m01.CDS01 [Neocucurbitaria sp. VM-36]
MVRRTDPKDDNWQYVKDAKKRKQIQDRLAQRARRQRLRQAKVDSTLQPRDTSTTQTRTPISSQSDSSPDGRVWRTNQSLIPYNGASLSGPSSTDVVDPNLQVWDLNPSLEDLLDYGPDTSDHSPPESSILDAGIFATLSPLAQPNTPYTVFSALYINGQILGIPCATTYSSRTPPPTPSTPLPLHATDAQRLIVHPRWFDRFPFPKMRDSLIKLQGVIDEEEIIKDLFTTPSWVIIEGRACWDPRAWKMEKEWAKKWGWLMY